MSTKKEIVLDFVNKYNIPVLSLVPVKSVLLSIIRELNLKKEFVLDNIAKLLGHELLELPPYYCALNPFKLIGVHLKTDIKKLIEFLC